jgi:predicted DNA-binding transcriptional regulator AlpA
MTPSKVHAVLKFYSLRDIAEYTGIGINSLKTLDRTGRFPRPDVQVGLGDQKQQIARGWSRDTIDEWLSEREQ